MTVSGKSERLRVELGVPSHDILVGPGPIARSGAEILPLMRRRQAVIVTKELAPFGRLVDCILACGIARGTMRVALGGAVCRDIAGFAAATLLLGNDFVQIPSSLLAQVDSSLHGTSPINTAPGKNLLGAFF